MHLILTFCFTVVIAVVCKCFMQTLSCEKLNTQKSLSHVPVQIVFTFSVGTLCILQTLSLLLTTQSQSLTPDWHQWHWWPCHCCHHVFFHVFLFISLSSSCHFHCWFSNSAIEISQLSSFVHCTLLHCTFWFKHEGTSKMKSSAWNCVAISLKCFFLDSCWKCSPGLAIQTQCQFTKVAFQKTNHNQNKQNWISSKLKGFLRILLWLRNVKQVLSVLPWEQKKICWSTDTLSILQIFSI